MGILETLGMANKPADAAGGSADTGAIDLTSIKSQASPTRKARRGRVADDAERMASQAEIDKLFDEENWEQLAGLYFKARFALTGWEGFNLSDRESRILTTTMSTAMRVLLKIDPAYIALIVFGANFGGIIASKELAYRELVKQARKGVNDATRQARASG